MNTRKALMGCGIALFAVMILVAIGLVVSTFIPKKVEPAIGVSPILVNITLPLNGAKLPLNQPVGVYAEAVGPTTVHDLELWVDGAFSPTKMDSSPLDRSPLTAVWQWTPATEGVHRLIVRAIGPEGGAVNSNVVRVSILPADQSVAFEVPTLPPDQPTPTPQPGGGEPLQPPEGAIVSTEPSPPPIPPPQPEDPAPGPAGTPILQGTINGCDASLLIQDTSADEDGFYLYRFDPTSTGFKNVATLDKHPGQGAFAYIDPGLETGAHTYYVASYKGGVESASNLVNLNVPQGLCKAPLAFGLQDALLTTTKAVDKVYCYLSVNGGPWERIPPGSGTFIYPGPQGFDLSDYLQNLISPPPPGGVTLELECWGWSGNTLVYLGYLKKDIGPGQFEIVDPALSLVGSALQFSLLETDWQILSGAIAPPYNLQFASDLADCLAHAKGLVSDALCNSIMQGDTVLTWHWSSGCPILKAGEQCPYTTEDIEGFRVYRLVPGSDPELIHDVHYPQAQVAEIIPSTGAMLQPQYYVRAYKGIEESADSEHIFGATPLSVATLKNPAVSGRLVYAGYDCGNDGTNTYNEYAIQGTSAVVGYDFYTSGTSLGQTCYYSDVRDARIVFDLSSIKGQVEGATLRWNDIGNAGFGGGAAGIPHCWIPLYDRNTNSMIADYPLDPSGVDVTTQVRASVLGLGNKGFAFLSAFRFPFKANGEQCQSTLGDFELDVAYK